MGTIRSMATHTTVGTCHHDCPDTCGWVVTVTDGVAVKLRGNPEHPYSKGELCPKVNRFLDRVYSPDRILHPLIRTGPKGSGEFEPTTWGNALALVAERVQGVVADWGGEAVLPWGSAGTQGLIQMSSLDRRFFARLGASRQTGSICGATAGAGTMSTTGSRRTCDPTAVRHAKLVVLWATNTRLTNRHLWPFVEEARANGATVVVIDPVRTMTAESADWFIQPRPGTDVALMLAMMHVLIRDSLVDAEYIAQYTQGFDELAAQVTTWTPTRAAAECGVAADEIERFAHAYGTADPAFIRTLIGAEHHEHGAMFFRALACLPTITGSWRHLGGGLARSVGAYNDANIDDSVFDAPNLSGGRERRGLNMNELGQVLTNDTLAPPVKALFVWNGNPVVTVPNAALIRRGLERDDLFTVVSEQFMTDTARYADVIFPACTQIEQVDVVPSWGHFYVGWNEPAIAPLGESVANTELWRRLSRAFGFTDESLFEADDSLLRSALHDLDIDQLQCSGFVRGSVPDDVRPFAQGGFETPSGRAELGGNVPPAYGVTSEAPTAGQASRFPLTLMSPKIHTRFLNSSYSHLPKHGGAETGPFLELHPDDAAWRHIADGDRVRVWNDRGELHLVAVVGRRLQPGVVAVPFGWWGDSGQGTVNDLTNDAPTDWGGGVAFGDTLVQVSRAL